MTPEDLVLRTVVVGKHRRSSESAVARDLRSDAPIARVVAALRSRASATQTISKSTQRVLHAVSLRLPESISADWKEGGRLREYSGMSPDDFGLRAQNTGRVLAERRARFKSSGRWSWYQAACSLRTCSKNLSACSVNGAQGRWPEFGSTSSSAFGSNL